MAGPEVARNPGQAQVVPHGAPNLIEQFGQPHQIQVFGVDRDQLPHPGLVGAEPPVLGRNAGVLARYVAREAVVGVLQAHQGAPVLLGHDPGARDEGIASASLGA